ncbi:MAG: hypothetical protein OIF57_17670 [Marinobacterium sp.]|nr:hypothetical protein [Marinobacterium sp.]
MEQKMKFPPAHKAALTAPEILAQQLAPLIGTKFNLVKKPKTDGANLRKLVSTTLSSSSPAPAKKCNFSVVPPKAKGVPRVLLEYIDTYLVTSGDSYNLQVWNRNPTADSVQVEYANGDLLSAKEVRFILIKVNIDSHIIESVVVLTPDYIVERFGEFGKPTIKSQIIISERARNKVLSLPDGLLYYPDDTLMGHPDNTSNLSDFSIHDEPTASSLLPLSTIKDMVKKYIIGQPVAPAATKNRGQMLEELIANTLGYSTSGTALAAGFPDIRNQALEVKIQDSPTIDLGKYTPEFEEEIENCAGFTTRNSRYLIALTNPTTSIIEGAILCPGYRLGEHFSYIANKNFKVQRTIKMSFFNSLRGQSVFNPEY